MAYQNIGNPPRFYINTLEWLASNSVITLPSDHFRTLPVNPTLFTNLDGFNWGISEVFNQNCFFAFLGHTRRSDYIADNSLGGIDLYLDPGGQNISYSNDIQINTGSGNFSVPEYDGFTLASITETGLFNMVLNAYGNVGSIILGTYFDMPHSPDLNLTMTREYGGVKTIETKGGASLSNAFYTKPPKWGNNLGAWELGSNVINHTGRRIWDLSWSYLSDEDIFPENPSEVNNEWVLNDNPETPDFMSEVVRKTNGGQLPFIFQPDGGTNGNSSPDQFAICKLDMNSFSFEQVANGVYNIKLKIREVW